MKKITFAFICAIFYSNSVFAYITENISTGCGVYSDGLIAGFEPFSYTCEAGYFLPADTLRCVACPDGATCDGGTFTFNSAAAQGIEYIYPITTPLNNVCSAQFQNLIAVFKEITTVNCSSGQYLPANADSCTSCAANSYCGGGTYAFNETISQGITSCPNNWYSPMGMSSVEQCGRILHIGDNVVYLRSVKKTSPSLHVKVDDTIFYGNMTTSDVVMNSGTDKKLKLQYDGQTYSVYDDTVVP